MAENRRTQAERDLLEAVDRYVVAYETPGVSSERHYHAMRHARQRVKAEDERAGA